MFACFDAGMLALYRAAMNAAPAASALPLRTDPGIHTVETRASAMAALRIIGHAGTLAPRAVLPAEHQTIPPIQP